jgi:hypothetical protein
MAYMLSAGLLIRFPKKIDLQGDTKACEHQRVRTRIGVEVYGSRGTSLHDLIRNPSQR